MTHREIPPPILFFICFVAGAVAQARYPLFLGIPSFRLALVLSSVILVVAAAIGAWAILEMKKFRAPIEPGSVPVHLVVTGPFRFTRNPLYLTLLLVLVALAVMADSVWLIASVVPLFVLLQGVVRREESRLDRAFGKPYEAYRARVRRWV
ncbi:MAG TPA: methyltransferase [Thermoanaerobaculia bacterium]|nr:methyltransferase [Thermoanaerobaculia bacterium]